VVFWPRKTITAVRVAIPREELIRRGRILVVDDERPELIDDLQKLGFSVDYVPDVTVDNIHILESGVYDLVLLDFANVGLNIGKDQGLSLLQRVKRTNPAVIVFAYTSKALGSAHADFYRLADGVLPKDASIEESAEKIEDGLRSAKSLAKLWSGFLTVAQVAPGSKQDTSLQDLFVRGITDPSKLKKLEVVAASLITGGAEKLGSVILEKVLELVRYAS
jgi:CheY-like chemotaxis protein